MTMDGWALSMEYVSTYGRVRWDVFGAGPPCGAKRTGGFRYRRANSCTKPYLARN
jgi:hypothetical protein